MLAWGDAIGANFLLWTLKWCLAGLILAIALSRSTTHLPKRYLALITLIWTLVFSPMILEFPSPAICMLPDGIGPRILFTLAACLAGAVTGWLLVRTPHNKGLLGAAVGAVSFGFGSFLGDSMGAMFLWSEPIWVKVVTMGAVSDFVRGSLGVAILIWYFSARVKAARE